MTDPQQTKAACDWAAMVDAHLTQTDRLRQAMRQEDEWQGRSKGFRPHRRDRDKDPAIDAVLEYVQPEDTVIDVGAGGGRLAIPMAQRCRRVIAVEISEAMRSELAAQASELGVENVTIVPCTWQEAEVEPADLVLCSHVLYAVRDIEPWVQKMAAKAIRRVVAVVFDRTVPPNMHALWEPVHGEKRLQLPSMTQFEALLSELGIEYDKRMLPERQDRTYASLDDAVTRAVRHLHVVDGTEEHDRLRAALEDGLVDIQGGMQLRWATPMKPGLITWAT